MRRRLLAVMLTAISVSCPLVLTSRASAQKSAAATYADFRASFQRIDFKTKFISWETPADAMPLMDAAVEFLAKQPAIPPDIHPPYKALATFKYGKNLDGYLVVSPSVLNGDNINLLIFNSTGRLLRTETLAGRYGDEGHYRERFGWIRDLNGDGLPDILLSDQRTSLSKNQDYLEYRIDALRGKTWNGSSYVNATLRNSSQLKKETDQDVGTFRLKQIQSWDLDPRFRFAAIESYQNWLQTYPGHPKHAEASARIEQLRGGLGTK